MFCVISQSTEYYAEFVSSPPHGLQTNQNGLSKIFRRKMEVRVSSFWFQRALLGYT